MTFTGPPTGLSGTDRTVWALREADAGRAHYARDRAMTALGNMGYWDLQQIGWEKVKPYIQHGGFNVDTEAVHESFLTPKGRSLLNALSTQA